jgi:hypothetical protein
LKNGILIERNVYIELFIADDRAKLFEKVIQDVLTHKNIPLKAPMFLDLITIHLSTPFK